MVKPTAIPDPVLKLALLALLIAAPCEVESVHVESNGTVLHLLTLLPGLSSTNRSTSVRDRGMELLPAAELAVEEINAREDILRNYTLKLIPAETETCDQNLITEALVNYVRYSTDDELNVVGILGLTCSAVTARISSLTSLNTSLSRSQVSAGGTSPTLKFDNLYRVVSSTEVYNEAVIELMDEFNWRRISIIRDTISVQHTGTAEDFEEKVNKRDDLELVLRGEVTPEFLTRILDELKNQENRIIYASLTALEASQLLCEASQADLVSPGYVWILHDIDFEALEPAGKDCILAEAFDNVFLLNYQLTPSDLNVTLKSEKTYNDFRAEYVERVEALNVPDLYPENNNYANAMYDSVWVFALALNGNVMVEHDYDIHDQLEDINFSGALGPINFNGSQDVKTTVNIFQVRKGKVHHIADYEPVPKRLTLFETVDVPRDTFDREVERISRAFPILIFILASLLIIVTTAVLVLFVYYWKAPDIKATSPILSLVILVGCYFLYIATFIVASREYATGSGFSFLCNAEIWFAEIGIELIFATLLVRILRVYHIFNKYQPQKIGKLWSDKILLVMILLIVSGLLVILVVWAAIDPFETTKVEELDLTENPPHYDVLLQCSSEADILLWLCVVSIYPGITGVLVLVLAIKTRRIKMESFKDTKKVSAYIFSDVIFVGFFFPLSLIFFFIEIPEGTFVFRVLTYMLAAALCKVFLFAPKIWTGIFKIEPKRKPPTSHSSSTGGKIPIRQSSGYFSDHMKSAKQQEVEPQPQQDDGAFRIFDIDLHDLVDYCNCCPKTNVDETGHSTPQP